MNPRDDYMSDLMLVGIVLILMWLGVGIYYQVNAGPINYALVEFNRKILYAFAHLPGSVGDQAASDYFRLAQLDPWELEWKNITALFDHVGRYLRWIVIPAIGGFIWWGFLTKQKVSDHYRMVHTMQTLVKHNVHEYPCMAPIANRKRSILDEPYDTGPWRSPKKTIQFVADNKLLLSKKGKPIAKKHLVNKHGLPNLRSKILKDDNNKGLSLDKEKAREIFMQQVGPKLSDFEDLPDYIRGLIGAFMAIGAGDKDAGFKLLDHMSVTFVEPKNEGDRFDIDIDIADQLIAKYKEHEDVLYHTDHHNAYLHPYLMALLEDCAKAKHGVVPSSRYIWLRPVNHLLFNCLNQMGGQQPWSEGAGPWAHYEAENMATQSLPEPEVANAVIGLEDKMILTGWIAPPKDWKDA